MILLLYILLFSSFSFLVDTLATPNKSNNAAALPSNTISAVSPKAPSPKSHFKKESSRSLPEFNESELYEKLSQNYLCPEVKVSTLLTNRKMRSLSYDEAVKVYLAAWKEKNARYIIDALERMYLAQPDELTLWNLAYRHFLAKHYQQSLFFFGQFRQFFPGSVHAWHARLKEIESALSLCQSSEYDSAPAEYVIQLGREYASDTYDYESPLYQKVLSAMQQAYVIIIEKEIDAIEHYLKKYQYTWSYGALFSVLKRLEGLKDILEDAETYEYADRTITGECLAFIETIKNLRSALNRFFSNHPLEIPYGKEYHAMLPPAKEYIEKHAKSIAQESSDYCSKVKQALKKHT